MIKNNKGISLLEVIISIAILGIVFISAISILSISNKITIKNERTENTLNEVLSIMDLFSSDPDNFNNNISEIYKINGTSNLDNSIVYKIYYTSAFIKKLDQTESNYYLEFTYDKELLEGNNLSKYTIDIKIYHNNNLYIVDNYQFTNRVIIK